MPRLLRASAKSGAMAQCCLQSLRGGRQFPLVEIDEPQIGVRFDKCRTYADRRRKMSGRKIRVPLFDPRDAKIVVRFGVQGVDGQGLCIAGDERARFLLRKSF